MSRLPAKAESFSHIQIGDSHELRLLIASQPVSNVLARHLRTVVTLYVFYLDGHIALDLAMRESVDQARQELPGIRIIETTSDHLSDDDYTVLQSFCFNGFPSIGATFDELPIFRQQGLLDGATLVTKLREAAPLYVAVTNGTGNPNQNQGVKPCPVDQPT